MENSATHQSPVTAIGAAAACLPNHHSHLPATALPQCDELHSLACVLRRGRSFPATERKPVGLLRHGGHCSTVSRSTTCGLCLHSASEYSGT